VPFTPFISLRELQGEEGLEGVENVGNKARPFFHIYPRGKERKEIINELESE
jgi:hypothetical protein